MADRNNQKRTSAAESDAAEHAAEVRKGYDAALEPERQGDGDPGTEPVGGDSGADQAEGEAGRQPAPPST